MGPERNFWYYGESSEFFPVREKIFDQELTNDLQITKVLEANSFVASFASKYRKQHV